MNELEKAKNNEMQIDRQVVDLHSLFELSKAIASHRNLKNILDILLLTPMGRMMIRLGAILLKTDLNLYQFYTVKGLPQSLVGRMIAFENNLQEVSEISQIADKHVLQLLSDQGLRLICPICLNENCLGMILLGEKMNQQPFTSDEVSYLSTMANLAAPIVDNSRYLRELKEVNRKLDKKIQELKTLFEIGSELNSTLDKKSIANTLAYAIMGEMMVQHCAIMLKNSNENFEIVVCKGFSDAGNVPLLNHQEKLNILGQRTETVPLDQIQDSSLRQLAEKSKFVLFVPMLSQEQVKGGILLGKRLNLELYEDSDVEFLSTLANAAIISFENARLFQETLEKQRMEEELAIARDIQRKLLPSAPPRIEGFDFAGINFPTHQVGGDYYDFIPIDPDHIAIAIGDVSGKGVPASLLMANLQASLHAMIHAQWPVKEIVRRMNNIIHKNTSIDKFITFFIAILNTRDLELTYVNAGHNPPFWVNKNRATRLLEEGGLILGMMPNAPYQQKTVTLSQDDWLVLFTDGVSEAMNERDEEFTEERIEATIRRSLDASAREMIENIATAVQSFCREAPQSDDITLLALKVNKRH